VWDKGLGHHWLVGTPILWLLASGGSVRSLSEHLAYSPSSRRLGSLGSLLVATFRLRPAERWLSCYVGRTSRLACWNPTAWCAACRDGVKQVETIGRYIAKDHVGALVQSHTVTLRLAWRCRIFQVLSLAGRTPIGLSPSSPQGGRSVNPLQPDCRLAHWVRWVRRRWNRARNAREGSTWAPILKKNKPQSPDDRIKN